MGYRNNDGRDPNQRQRDQKFRRRKGSPNDKSASRGQIEERRMIRLIGSGKRRERSRKINERASRNSIPVRCGKQLEGDRKNHVGTVGNKSHRGEGEQENRTTPIARERGKCSGVSLSSEKKACS